MAIENGAGGGKACGAGGGGCILFYCNLNQDHLVRKVLEENGGRVTQTGPQGELVWRG